MFEVWKFNVKKKGLPQLSQGWFEVPDAIQWLESSFDLDAAPPADTAVQRWSLFGSCMRPTAVEEEETEVVFLWEEEFLLGPWGLETNHACNNIFSRFRDQHPVGGNRTCLCGTWKFPQKSGKSGCQGWKVCGIFSPGPGAFAFQFSSQIGLQ